MNGGLGTNWVARRVEQFPHLGNYTLSMTVAADFSVDQPTGRVLSCAHNTFHDRSFTAASALVWNNLTYFSYEQLK